jgi:hypothetical protein
MENAKNDLVFLIESQIEVGYLTKGWCVFRPHQFMNAFKVGLGDVLRVLGGLHDLGKLQGKIAYLDDEGRVLAVYSVHEGKKPAAVGANLGVSVPIVDVYYEMSQQWIDALLKRR